MLSLMRVPCWPRRRPASTRTCVVLSRCFWRDEERRADVFSEESFSTDVDRIVRDLWNDTFGEIRFYLFFFFFEGLFCKNSLFFLLRFVIFNIRCFYNIIFNLQRFLLKIIYHFI